MPTMDRRALLGGALGAFASMSLPPILEKTVAPVDTLHVRGWFLESTVTLNVSKQSPVLSADEVEELTGGRILAPRPTIIAPPRRTAIMRASSSEIDRYGRRIIPIRSMVARPTRAEVRRYAMSTKTNMLA